MDGSGFAETEGNNFIRFWSEDLEQSFVGPALTEDDQFLSNVPTGMLVYRVPSPHVLMGLK